MPEQLLDGSELVAKLSLLGSLIPDVDRLEAYIQACDREDAVGPLFYPDVHRRAEKRLRALRDLARTAVKMRHAWEVLQEAAAEESNPELDRAAQTLYAGFHRKAREQMGEADHA